MVLVCFVNCPVLFSIYFSCYQPTNTFASYLKVESSSTPCAVSCICQTSVGLILGATLFAVSLGFVYIFICIASVAFMFAWLPDYTKTLCLLLVASNIAFGFFVLQLS